MDRIVAVAVEAKGLPDDKRLHKHITDTARRSLMRMAREGRVRRVVQHPDTWWELAER